MGALCAAHALIVSGFWVGSVSGMSREANEQIALIFLVADERLPLCW